MKPEECGLGAVQPSDLKGAKACGFYTIYIDRPLEEKNLELREESIPAGQTSVNKQMAIASISFVYILRPKISKTLLGQNHVFEYGVPISVVSPLFQMSSHRRVASPPESAPEH